MIRPTITLRRNRIVVDVDTQRHYFEDNGTVCVRNYLGVLANIRRVIAWTRLRHIRIVSTIQVSAENTSCFNFFYVAGIGGLKKVGYTLRNRYVSFDATDCTDLPKKMLEQYDQVILYKRCVDPFEEPRADRMFTELEADESVLIGTLTEGAVKATALGLLARRKNVTVLVDATGSRDKHSARIALRHMWAKGAKLTDTQTLLGSSGLRLVRGQPCANF